MGNAVTDRVAGIGWLEEVQARCADRPPWLSSGGDEVGEVSAPVFLVLNLGRLAHIPTIQPSLHILIFPEIGNCTSWRFQQLRRILPATLPVQGAYLRRWKKGDYSALWRQCFQLWLVRVLSFKGDWRRPSLVIFVPFLNPELNETEQPVLAKD